MTTYADRDGCRASLDTLIAEHGIGRVLSVLEDVALDRRARSELTVEFKGWERIRELMSTAATFAASRGLR